jgi:hypothetical protein
MAMKLLNLLYFSGYKIPHDKYHSAQNTVLSARTGAEGNKYHLK